MASIRIRTTKQGKPYYTVAWYDRGTQRNLSRTFHDKAKAQTLRDYLDANSNTLSLAQSAKRQTDSATMTVWDMVSRHLEQLRGVSPGTAGTYRRDMTRHLEGTSLAGVGVEYVTTEMVSEWVDSLTLRNGEPASWKTRHNQHAVLSAAFNRLIQDPGTRSNLTTGCWPGFLGTRA